MLPAGYRIAWAVALGACGLLRAGEPTLDGARRDLARGRYAEALAAFERLAAEHPAEAARGLARCHSARGRYDAAERVLRGAAEREPLSAELQAELALLAWQRGDREEAGRRAAAALEREPSHLAARWLTAKLDQESGRLEAAGQGYAWLVRYYNQHQPLARAEEALWIGRGAAEHARWKRLPDQFQFLVGELYPGAVRLDPDCWEAHLAAGRLYLEKFNEADAARKFAQALAINPQAAEVHAAMAELALIDYDLPAAERHLNRAEEINPRLPLVHELRADWHLANFQIPEAVECLEEARKLNPVAESTLGRAAAIYALVDGWRPDDPRSRLGGILAEVTQRNPHCGEFYLLLGQRLEERRRFSAAEASFLEAVRRMPELLGPQASLGLMHMRLGREEEARRELQAALEADPFHVRASNMAKVLEVLDGYQTRSTEHFHIRHDPRDELLARYAGQYLESAYPELCQSLGYEPSEPTLFEIFRQARQTSGHGWFSARMIGLPYVGAVGACAGTMVAMTSPNDGPPEAAKFNWARVLRHEFVHVLNLRQTDFHIPHWFTEGLAVLHEDLPRPESWNRLLARRVPRRELFDLSDLNLGFIRPESAEDRDLAYCQAELYVEYFQERFGETAVARLLEAFRQTPDTHQALRRAFEVEPALVEREYLEYLDRVTAALPASGDAPIRGREELVRWVRQRPDDWDAWAELAENELGRRNELARKAAQRVLDARPGHPRASYVLARLLAGEGEFEQAAEVLARSMPGADQEQTALAGALALRAALCRKAGEWAEMERLCLLGTRRFGGDSSWLAALAQAQEALGKPQQRAATLGELAAIEFDDVDIRRELAELHLELGAPDEAGRWALAALHIDVLDTESHRLRGVALAAGGDAGGAAEEFDIALRLSGRATGELRRAVAAAREQYPEHAALRLLAEKLSP